MTRSPRIAGPGKVLAVAVVLMLIGAACRGGDDAAAETPLVQDGSTTTFPVPDEAGTPDAERQPAGPAAVAQVVSRPVDFGRDIVYTADLAVAVTDVAAASDQAIRAIEGLGGFLFGRRSTGSPVPSSVLTFKVFPDNFQEALSRLGSLGDIRSQNVSADDVTDRVVDLESRINTAAASVERLRAFLAEATSIDVIARLENELLARETTLETLRGQLRTLQDQVALATIAVALTEAAAYPAVSLQVTAYPGHDREGLSCPSGGSLTVDEGTDITFCFEIVNTGDTALADIELHDPVLDVDRADLIVVYGDPDGPIEPGQSLLFAFEASAERDLRTRTTVEARPIAPDGSALTGRNVAATETIFIDAVDPGGVPGFADGVRESWGRLVSLARLLMLLAGWLVPFAWIPALAWLVLRLRGRGAAPAGSGAEPA